MTSEGRNPPPEIAASLLETTLVGGVLRGVRYFNVAAAEQGDWRRSSEDTDRLDFGLDLDISGSTYGLTWMQTPMEYRLAAFDGSLGGLLSGYQVEDVSETTHWRAVVGRAIGSARLYWSEEGLYWSEKDGVHGAPFPLTLELLFLPRGLVLMSAAGLPGGSESVVAGLDEIVVMFDRQLAQRCGLLPQGPHDP